MSAYVWRTENDYARAEQEPIEGTHGHVCRDCEEWGECIWTERECEWNGLCDDCAEWEMCKAEGLVFDLNATIL